MKLLVDGVKGLIERREGRVLAWVGVMFLPAIPAYLWFWPRVTPETSMGANALAYAYVAAGTLWIGRKHYPARALGLNGNGIAPALAWGGLVVLGRTLVILGVDWGAPPPAFAWGRALMDALFYFGLVGFTEELLFRGLIYRALLEWKGTNWAIYGSSVGFMLWHVFGQGLLAGAATLLYGWIFGLMRWRTGRGRQAAAHTPEMGGIWGLVVVHGLIDFAAAQMLPSLDVVGLGRPEVPQPWMLAVGLALILAAPLGLELLRRLRKTPPPDSPALS